MTIYLRSSITGKVLTQKEWQHSLNEWDDEGGASDPADEFIEVVKDEEGNWIEKIQLIIPMANELPSEYAVIHHLIPKAFSIY